MFFSPKLLLVGTGDYVIYESFLASNAELFELFIYSSSNYLFCSSSSRFLAFSYFIASTLSYYRTSTFFSPSFFVKSCSNISSGTSFYISSNELLSIYYLIFSCIYSVYIKFDLRAITGIVIYSASGTKDFAIFYIVSGLPIIYCY